jgi:hypothetical protein
MPAADDGAANSGGRRPKPSNEGNRDGERVVVPRALTYRELTVVTVIRQHNFSVMARTLLTVENDFRILCLFKELRVAKIAHISTSALCP